MVTVTQEHLLPCALTKRRRLLTWPQSLVSSWRQRGFVHRQEPLPLQDAVDLPMPERRPKQLPLPFSLGRILSQSVSLSTVGRTGLLHQVPLTEFKDLLHKLLWKTSYKPYCEETSYVQNAQDFPNWRPTPCSPKLTMPNAWFLWRHAQVKLSLWWHP